MSTHEYRTVSVPVAGGALRVGVWEPLGESTQTVLAIHGVTASHLAWPLVVEQLPDMRIIAPDLRGRGASNAVQGPAGMTAHADDLAAVLDALDAAAVTVLGHSMGAFVAVVFAYRHPTRVQHLVLVDGGLPLDVPAGIDPAQLVPLILGPVAERLSRRWPDARAYTEEFWRGHPAFVEDWSDELDAYIAYDLVPDGDLMRSATSAELMGDDVVDMNTGSVLPEALAALPASTLFISVPRGLQNETPGLYPPAHLQRLLAQYPAVRHVHLDDLNHYTVVMGHRGAAALGELVRGELVRGELG
ncbi:alpha/beta hydrolase [Microbacterium sp. H1-D42]|uniref:alpha/beta hydrolase n=1 Tax=Microbacterium sp. H1-D42 TaxID=2925844 RepID=UPI001F52D26C|nr:alpha/beta hydrolase [Microbacterium sp. H1-D42]UNK69488.1 alpha/beta hydrolase [Microbacterium sp. H1-D42]